MTKRGYRFSDSAVPVGSQILAMKTRHPDLRLISWTRGEARWQGTIRPTDVSETYATTLTYRLHRRPRVHVGGLVKRGDEAIPHLHRDGSLCLHLPNEWNASMIIAETIVPWAALWLYHYEVWHATAQWQGGGVHPPQRRHAGRNRSRPAAQSPGAA